MAHFAKINQQRIVTKVIVADEEYVETLPGTWLQTSYNTYGGVHQLGGTPFRKNFAGVGFTYDYMKDAFIPPKEYDSWTLNETTCLWESPVPYPTDGKTYVWNESNKEWYRPY
jgi:hypothetical protein